MSRALEFVPMMPGDLPCLKNPHEFRGRTPATCHTFRALGTAGPAAVPTAVPCVPAMRKMDFKVTEIGSRTPRLFLSDSSSSAATPMVGRHPRHKLHDGRQVGEPQSSLLPRASRVNALRCCPLLDVAVVWMACVRRFFISVCLHRDAVGHEPILIVPGQRTTRACIISIPPPAMEIARTPYFGPSRKLVVALDVGTTFSGAAYAFLDPGEVPQIRPVTRHVSSRVLAR